MAYLVLTALTILAAGAAFVGGRIYHSENPGGKGLFVAYGSLVAAAFAFIALTLIFSIDIVSPGHIGIKKSFGKLVGTAGNGMVLHNPWTSIASVSVQNTLRTYDMTKNNSAVTSDSQPVFMSVQVNYQVKRGEAVNLYQSTGGDFVNRILDPNVYQLTKAVTARYTATAFAENRDTIRVQIEKALKDAVSSEGLQIDNVSLVNVQFTPALQAAIERTVESKQNAKQAQAQVQVVKAQAEQKVAQARGIAQSTLVQARANAEAQRLQNHTLTPLLVQKEAIDKLNPNVQIIVCATGKVCVPQAVIATAQAGK